MTSRPLPQAQGISRLSEPGALGSRSELSLLLPRTVVVTGAGPGTAGQWWWADAHP